MKPFLGLFLLFLASCTAPPSPPAIPVAEPVKQSVLENLKRPWSMAFLSETEVLLAEKDGDLLQINLDTKEKRRIKGLPQDLADSLTIDLNQYEKGIFPNRSDGYRGKFNAGLFEVLLDPQFSKNQWIYLSYAARGEGGHTTKVIRAQLQNDSLTQMQTLLTALPFSHGLFHFGGGMTFGADGKLYITIGERLFSEANQPPLPIAQNIEDRRGKIYRLNPDGSIPTDNPVIGENAVPGLYAIGIRAAQGLTLHPQSGKIWFTEHGTHQGDEINLLKAGANYGWPNITTGKYRGPGYEPPTLENVSFTDPVWYWLQTVAPTGLVFYTGDEFPYWKNDLLISGLSRGSLWRVKVAGEKIKSLEELLVEDRHRARKIVQSPEGKLYLLTDEDNGKIIRVKNAAIKSE